MDERHYQMARRLSRRYRIAGMSREDVEQQALLYILEALQAGTSDDSHLFNQVRSKLRNLSRRQSLDLLGDHDLSVVDPDSIAGIRDVDDADGFDAFISRYLDFLSPREIEIIRLEMLEGLDHAAIAARLGIKVRTVQQYRWSAIEKIRSIDIDEK